jgi:hypothetical protein
MQDIDLDYLKNLEECNDGDDEDLDQKNLLYASMRNKVSPAEYYEGLKIKREEEEEEKQYTSKVE